MSLSQGGDGWVRVCASEDVADRPKGVRVEGARVVVWRTASGRLVAMDDSCPHQGNPLSSGAVLGETLRCASHGWLVGSDGWCDEAGSGARTYAVREAEGEISVRLAGR